MPYKKNPMVSNALVSKITRFMVKKNKYDTDTILCLNDELHDAVCVTDCDLYDANAFFEQS